MNVISIDEPDFIISQLEAKDWNGNLIDDFTVTGNDGSLFSISNENILILNSPSNYEIKNNYSLDIIATDTAGNSALKNLIRKTNP